MGTRRSQYGCFGTAHPSPGKKMAAENRGQMQSRNTELKVVTNCELKLTRRRSRRRDLSESSRVNVCIRQSKNVPVEYVECIGAKLQPMSFPRHPEVLGQTEIQVPEARTSKVIARADLSTDRISEGVKNGVSRVGVSEEPDSSACLVDVLLQQ